VAADAGSGTVHVVGLAPLLVPLGRPPLPQVLGGEAEPGGDGVALVRVAAAAAAEGVEAGNAGDGAAEGAPLSTHVGVYAAFAASLSSQSASLCSSAVLSSSRIFMSRERSLDALRYCATRWLDLLSWLVSTAVVDDLAGVSFVESDSVSDLEPQQPIGERVLSRLRSAS